MSAGVRPPMVMWLPPPVPRWLPSTANVSVPSRLCRASSYSVVVTATCSSQLAERLDVDLDDARVRGHRQGLQARVVRRAVALQHHRRADRGGRVLHGRDQLDPRVEFLERRQEHIQQCRPATSATSAVVGTPFGAATTTARGFGPSLDDRQRGLGGAAGRVPARVSGGTQEIASSGSRRPAGESPVSSTIRPRRSRQSALPQPIVGGRLLGAGSSVSVSGVGSGAASRCSGSTKALGSVTDSSSSCSSSSRASGLSASRSVGHRLAGRHPDLLRQLAERVLVGRPDLAGRQLEELGDGADKARRRGPDRDAGPRLPRAVGRSVVAHGSASSAGSDHSGTPSARQCSAICQRGNGSPGYHLPWPRCTTPPGA